jgi:hypothetical protein
LERQRGSTGSFYTLGYVGQPVSRYFRGDFGVMNSGRKDIEYEDWHGHKLDRKMLEMLQKH